MSQANSMLSATSAAVAGLVYVSDATPGLRRVRHGRNFVYLTPRGERVSDPAELDRIAGLAIPPAYEDVWICLHRRGHLQATGRDARGRKQYRYHRQWRIVRDAQKFERMPAFADALPRLRRRLRRDLALSGMPREKVLAIVVSLLDVTRARIGNAEYARDNASYGLTTLENRHVRFISGGRLVLRFPGKGGADHEIAIDDKRLARFVRHCHQLPGQQLFQYVDEAGEPHPVDSDQVNAYLRESMGEDFTAKDFRTWNATLRAMQIMRATPVPEGASERALASCIVEAVKRVAAELRNTPAVCRKSYINPIVFDTWRCGALHARVSEEIIRAPRKAERLAGAFLRRHAAEAVRRTEPRRREQARPFRTRARAVPRSHPAASAIRAAP